MIGNWDNILYRDAHWSVYGYIYFEFINNTYSKKKVQINNDILLHGVHKRLL